MSQSDLSTIGETAPWLLYVIFALLTFRFIGQALSEGSEAWAKALGPFGKRWRDRGRRRRNRDLEHIDGLEKRLDDFVVRIELLDEYLIYDARWHADIERWAATQLIEWPPPAHMTFRQFQQSKETP